MNTFYIVFSVIIATCSLLSPGIVAFINNRHQLKLRKLDIAETDKIHANEIIDGYFRSVGACLGVPNDENLALFGEYSNLIYSYLPEEYHEDISKLNNFIFSYTRDQEAIDLFMSLSTKYARDHGKRK